MQLILHAGAECIGLDLDPSRREIAPGLWALSATFAGTGARLCSNLLAEATKGRGVMRLFLDAEIRVSFRLSLSWLRRGRDGARLCELAIRSRTSQSIGISSIIANSILSLRILPRRLI
jgi:hypothetical protein